MYKTYFQHIPETENTYETVCEKTFPSELSELDALRFVNALNKDAEYCMYWIELKKS